MFPCISFCGSFLVNNMQTPASSKRADFFSWSKKLRNVLKRIKNQFSQFCDFQFLRYGRSKSLESSETHFDLVASRFGAKINYFGHFTPIFHTILRILNDHISKTENCKNRKIDFSFVSEHFATF